MDASSVLTCNAMQSGGGKLSSTVVVALATDGGAPASVDPKRDGFMPAGAAACDTLRVLLTGSQVIAITTSFLSCNNYKLCLNFTTKGCDQGNFCFQTCSLERFRNMS